MSAGNTTANLPPRFTNWRRIWVRFAWMAIFAVLALSALVLSNLAWNSRREEPKPVAKNQDAGVKFTPVVKAEPVTTMPQIKQEPPPKPVFDFAGIKQDLPVGNSQPVAAKGSALFAYAAHTSEATEARAVAGPPGSNGRLEAVALGDDPLSASLRPASFGKTGRPHVLGHDKLIIPAGTQIGCTLDQRLITQLAGFVTCHTWQEVRGADPLVPLLPVWTTFFGHYKTVVSQGNDRIDILFTNARTPSPGGINIPINSPAVDELGSAGISGYLDNHVGDKALALVAYTMLQAGPAIAQTALQNNSRGGNSYNTTNITGPTENVLGGWLQQKLQRPPTVLKNEGEAIGIVLAQDMDLSCCIKLELINDR